MDNPETHTSEFEANRARLTHVATRILGDAAGAEDAVQECWFRLERSDAAKIDNPAGWMTTTTARICLDMLRQRARVIASAGDRTAMADPIDPVADPASAVDLAEAVGEAMAVVLEALNPAERIAFVLHDTFGISFEEIAAVLERSPNAAKQLATRARTKIRRTDLDATGPPPPSAEHAGVVDAFLHAARGGDLSALVAVLHPDIVLSADGAAVAMGSPALVRGAANVAAVFSGRAQMAVASWIDGIAGVSWQVGGRTKVAWEFTIVDGIVVRIDMVADPDTLDAVEVEVA